MSRGAADNERAPERKPERFTTCAASNVGPALCSGGVAHIEGVPLCESHRRGMLELTGPWRTASGARDWLESAKSVWLARANLGDGRVLLEQPSGARDWRPRWVNWNDPEDRARMSESFQWIGGTPGWDSSDDRLRGTEAPIDNDTDRGEHKKKQKSKGAKKPEKPGKNARNFWHWKKFRGAKK